MNKEEREWILNNVEEICIDTKDVDEISIGLEHLSIFASEAIKDLATTVLDLQSQLDITNKKIEEVREYIKENACYDEKTKECKCSFSSMALDNILSIIGGE